MAAATIHLAFSLICFLPRLSQLILDYVECQANGLVELNQFFVHLNLPTVYGIEAVVWVETGAF